MQDGSDILTQARQAAKRRILLLPHAVRQMSSADRMISTREVRGIVDHGEIIEDYPEDPRGHSCLMLGRGQDQRPLHVVCAPKDDFLVVVTAHLPDREQWSEDFRTRCKP